MKQVFLSGKGEIVVEEVPIPLRFADSTLVRHRYTLISAGTESAAVSSRRGWLGVLEKARASPSRVGQVWDLVQRQGISQARELVQRKLEDFQPIGYSGAGVVVETDSSSVPFKLGERIATMGTGFASHAGFVTVPRLLAARVPEGVALEHAAFGAVACIAIQGVRRLDLTPGEHVGVVGLGLVGQLCARVLAAMGYEVAGIDLSPTRAQLADRVDGISAWSQSEADPVARVRDLTAGRGLDGVIVCAATSSDAPINLAFDLCRRRGRVSLVGSVGLKLAREKMYAKELELRMSTSYGPGRYDSAYEIQGQDYPLAYVRWTQQRNLEFFLRLLRDRVDLTPLVSEIYNVEDAPRAYAQVKSKRDDLLGTLLRYGSEEGDAADSEIASGRLIHRGPDRRVESGAIGLGLVGAGGFTKGVHLPNLKKLTALFEIVGVASRTGSSAAIVGRGMKRCLVTSDYRTLLERQDIDAVLITTRHASHGRIVLEALEAGKHVFVEKPMTTGLEEAQAIVERVDASGLVLRVGFNRRFAPALQAMRKAIGSSGRRTFTCRVNLGDQGSHWSNTAEEGGRLVGEGVHFFDLCNWFLGQEPIGLSAVCNGQPGATNPNISASLRYPDGSVAQVLYTTLGDPRLGKECFEAFGNGVSARLEDFRELTLTADTPRLRRRQIADKGQLGELRDFAACVRGDTSWGEGADARAGLLATWAALAVVESARERCESRPPAR